MINLLNIKKLLENDVQIKEDIYFTAIIGVNPSGGARSPILWNHVFLKENIKCEMHAFDVNEKNLSKLLKQLESNKFFLGGAVTAPYKEKIFELLNGNTQTNEKKIGAINCLFRDHKGNLTGKNTDGSAALKSLKSNCKNINEKKIILLGVGGAGKAVATLIASEIPFKRNLCLVSRSNEAKKFSKNIYCDYLEWGNLENTIKDYDIIINCTDIGFGTKVSQSPLSEKIIRNIKNTSTIFDIIYDPSPTILLKSAKDKNLTAIDGREMNLLQAAIAFDYTIKRKNTKITTYEIMYEKYINLN